MVIPTWQRAAWLERALAAVARQEPLPSEIIVVGRAEDPEARAVVESRREQTACSLRWAEISLPGHVAPVRRGLKEAQGDVVIFLDDDAEPEPGWLSALVKPFADPDVACVGGRVITDGFQGTVRDDAGRTRWYGRFIGNVAALDVAASIEVDGVTECNWAWRSQVLRAVNFDPVLDFDDGSMYGLELCLQAKAKGYRVVYEPKARVLHHAAPRDPALDRGDRPRRAFAYSRNYTYLALKHLRGSGRRIAFLGWWWLLGERGSYGLGKAAADVLLGRNGVVREARASLAGKREGLRLWRTQGR